MFQAVQSIDQEARPHLKGFGYAHGSYQVACCHCGITHVADKRATACRACAEKHFVTLGAPSEVFKESRADGWPFCPVCEEDELYSLRMLNYHGQGEKPSLADCLAGEMRCYRCAWSSEKPRAAEVTR